MHIFVLNYGALSIKSGVKTGMQQTRIEGESLLCHMYVDAVLQREGNKRGKKKRKEYAYDDDHGTTDAVGCWEMRTSALGRWKSLVHPPHDPYLGAIKLSLMRANSDARQRSRNGWQFFFSMRIIVDRQLIKRCCCKGLLCLGCSLEMRSMRRERRFTGWRRSLSEKGTYF